MFSSIGWGEILLLVVAGLFILGPERLPEGAAWLAKTIRQVKDYATGAKESLRSELGPEFDELRKPLEDLRGLRNFNPRTMAKRALFDDDPPAKPNGFTKAKPQGDPGVTSGSGATNGTAAPVREPLSAGERPPIDTDAT